MFEFSGTYDSVHFRNVLANLVPIALHQASCDDQLAGPSGFVAGHFKNGIHRLLLRALDERASVNDDYFSVFGTGNKFGARLGEHAHHDLAVHQVLGAAEAHESYLRGGGFRFGVKDRHGLRRHAISLF